MTDERIPTDSPSEFPGPSSPVGPEAGEPTLAVVGAGSAPAEAPAEGVGRRGRRGRRRRGTGEPVAGGGAVVRTKRPPSLWRELPVLIVIAVALAFVFKTFFIAVFFIPSGSMERTLHGCDGCTGDRVVVNKLIYDFRDPHRGEIVVFNGKNTNFPNEEAGQPTTGTTHAVRKALSFVGLGTDPSESDFIKRVIAVGGDTISCPAVANNANNCRNVVVNGHPVDEASYLFEDQDKQLPFQAVFSECRVPQGSLFVMGDHRDDSADSREHGTIPVGSVIGKAFSIVWPPSRINGLAVPKVWQQNLAPSAQAASAAASVPACSGTS